jgi:hypothetical protein
MLFSSLLASPMPWRSLKKSLLYLPYFLAFLALVHYLAPAEKLQEAWRAFYAFGSAAICLSVIGFYLIYFGLNTGMVRIEYGSLWLRGTMVASNIMGSTAAIVSLAALIRLTAATVGPSKRKALDMAVLATAIAALLMSYSRGAWLGFLGGVVVVVFLRRQELALKSAAAVLFVMVGSCVFVITTTGKSDRLTIKEKRGVTLGEYGEAAKDVVLRQKTGNHAQGVNYSKKIKTFVKIEPHDHWRFWVAKQALKDWRISPIIGRGTDSLQFAGKPNLPLSRFLYFIPVTLLAMLHDWGLIGLLLHGAFLLAAWIRLAGLFHAKMDENARELALALLSVLIMSTFMYQISTAMQLAIFWCLLSFYAAGMSLTLRSTMSPAKENT